MTEPALPNWTDAAPTPGQTPAAWWEHWAARLEEDLQGLAGRAVIERGAFLRDVMVVLPTTHHVVLARGAWALRSPGWPPRFETTQTLAQGLAPPPVPQLGDITLEPSTDQLRAAHLLKETRWGRAWAARDVHGFEASVARVVTCAHELWWALSALAPTQRAGFIDQARHLLSAQDGVDAPEAALARVALEWAACSSAWPSDVLFSHRPSAWVFVHLATPAPLALALTRAAQEAGVPVLSYAVWRGQACDDPVLLAGVPAPQLRVCRDFEDEAQETAAQVLQRVHAGATPVALVVQDRELARRVRALLERSGLRLRDDSGWRLSTTRAAAAFMAVLRAAHPMASTDDVLDVLKSADTQAALKAGGEAVQALESGWRSLSWSRAWTPPSPAVLATWGEGGSRLLGQLQHAFAPLREMNRCPLPQALDRWREVLQRCGVWQRWERDAAGAQAVRTLHLDAVSGDGSTRPALAESAPMDMMALRQWADTVLENQDFVPPSPQAAADVVITSLGQSLLRPFACVVLPGADEQHLGGTSVPTSLLNLAARQRLGLATAGTQQLAQLRGLDLLLQTAPVVLLRRCAQEDQPLGPSPWLLRLQLQLQRRGLDLVQPPSARVPMQVTYRPQTMPEPSLRGRGALWPGHLSAHGYEALRDCPYRYYGMQVLRLREAAELDEEIEPRDLGLWVHAILHAFHEERRVDVTPEQDVARLREQAQAQAQRLGLSGEEFLPHRLWFDALAPGYVAWMHQQLARGQAYAHGELALRSQARALSAVGLTLVGRLDRVDTRGTHHLLLDYKTGGLDALKKKTAKPQEETQLTFYALLFALSRGWEDEMDRLEQRVATSFLPLPSKPGDAVGTLDVLSAPSMAGELLVAVADDFRRLQDGEPLRALGQGDVCERCAVRGLCRRDDWAVVPGEPS